MELPGCSIKKFIISQKKYFLIFQETETTKKLFIFSQKKAVLIFRETEILKKNSLYFSRNFQSPKNQNLLYFYKKSYE